MIESTTVTVGLDVHARSIRLAAVRADELLEERTLPYDEDAVARLRRPVAGGEWSAPTHLSWVAGDGPVEPHTEVADHG